MATCKVGLEHVISLTGPAEIASTIRMQFGIDQRCQTVQSAEVLACAIRHAASRLCPCGGRALIGATTSALATIVPSTFELKQSLETSLEAVIAYGDLYELRLSGTDISPVGGTGPLVYLAPPCYVRRNNGSLLLVGVTPDEVHAAREITSLVSHRSHARYVEAALAHEAVELLAGLGYRERSATQWMQGPPESTPAECIRLWDNRLDGATPSGEIPDLVVLSNIKPVRYYTARWVSPRAMNGRYVGRRQQRYGADLWCYVELLDGSPQRFVDMPSGAGPWRGCDEAWHMIAALDAARGTPQEATWSISEEEALVLHLYGPVPAWVQRRWDSLGTRVEAPRCLFAYSFEASDGEEEIDYLRRNLWTSTVARK